jgi:Rod binding domain-containing protein
MIDISALPSAPTATLPADVRNGTPEDKNVYKAALGFERILMGELVQDMTKAGGLEDSPRAGAIQDAMSDALQGAGGVGLARQLFDSMHAQSPATAAKNGAR